MEGNMDIYKIILILEKIEVIGVSAKKVMADNKVDLLDLPVAISLLSEINGMIEAFKGASEALDEVKDLDGAEALEIVKKLYEVGKEIEQA